VEVEALIEEIGWHEDINDAIERVGRDGLLAIVLAGRPPVADVDRHLRTLHDVFMAANERLPPVTILLDGEIAPKLARTLYALGATAVAQLTDAAHHDDGELFRGLVPRALAAKLAAGSPEAPASVDVALARQARIRLALTSPRYTRLTVNVDDGTAYVRGALGILWRRVHVERIVAATPGIDDVIVENVRIDGHEADAALDAQIRTIVQHEFGRETAVSWSVDHGQVVFAGAVASREELKRLLASVRHLRGIRGIENDLVVSPEQAKRDGEVARRIVRRLDSLGVDARVDAGVVGHFAVLRGSVEDEGRKELVRRTVKGVRGIDRVVDELEVS